MKRKSFALVLLGLGVVGCEVGPDYKPPQITVNPAWSESAQTRPTDAPTSVTSTPTTRPVPIAQWWSNFHDPELDSLVDRGLKNNLDLHNARDRVIQARAQRGVVGSDLFPSINADGGYQRARGSKNVVIPASAFGGAGASPAAIAAATPAATPGLTPAAVVAVPAAAVVSPAASASGGPQSPLGLGGFPGVDTELYQAGFDASWELDVFGGQRRNVEAADADTAAAVEDHRDVMISLVSELARDYIELRATQKQEQIAAENLKDQQDTLDLTRSRHAAGFATDLDVARQAGQVATTAATLPALEASEHRLIHQISILLGQDPDSLTSELTSQASIPPAPPEVPVGMPADLLRRRPDIRRAERQLAAATARIGAATADLYPKFSITGSFGLDSSKLRTLPDWDSHYFALSPGVSWPIFDAGRINNNINVQKSLADQAATNYRQTVLGALRDVEDALCSYRTEQTRRQALSDAADAAKSAVDLSREQYQQGVIDFLAVLDAQRSLLAAQDNLTQSDSAISTDLVALYKALGGGWESKVQ